MNILQVNTADQGSGAERVGFELHRAFRSAGHPSWLAVGRKETTDPDVLPIPHVAAQSRWLKACIASRQRAQASGRHAAARLADRLSRLDPHEGARWAAMRRGREVVQFPACRDLLDLPPRRPDLVHCHNLHGDPQYFDLRVLARISHVVPTAITLHDAWLFSGHCAYALDCDRWKTGCGDCPDLTLYPSIRRDGTRYNWRRKRAIFAASHLHIITPCHWLMNAARESILAPAIRSSRVIPYGIDLSVFRPAPQADARRLLGIDPGARVVLASANRIRTNVYKDYDTIRRTIAALAARDGSAPIVYVFLGESGAAETVGRAEIRYAGFDHDRTTVAAYYQAADVYMHAARADTFPLAVLESLACGTPVVATTVGGIAEQIADGVTGFLVPPRDPAAMADRVSSLLSDESLRQRLAGAAAADARTRFSLSRMVNEYLEWFGELSRDHVSAAS